MKVKPSQISLFDFDEPEQQQPEPAMDAPDVNAANPTIAGIYQTKEEDIPTLPPVAVVPIDVAEIVPIDLTASSFSKNNNYAVKLPEVAQKSKRGRKSIEEMTASVSLVNVPEDEILFQKRYYAIGKVAEMFNVNPSLLRLWENEFDVLKPKKNGKGDRFFRPEDIKNIQLIHHLMRDKKYTMQGAKDYFKKNKRSDDKFAMIESLKKIQGFLYELKANL